jgi:ATP-binding cassette subfamily F protein uup
MLADYPGTVLVVSHDRDFLDRVATSIVMAEGDGRWTEYAGGYSDMVAQRGAGVGARTVEARAKPAAAKPAPPPAAPPPRQKLSFKDKHALETLPGVITALEKEIAALHAALADPRLYASDPNGFAEKSRELEKKTAARAAAEEQWLELEIKREALEG